jgi:transposase
MGFNFRGGDRDQAFLMPPSVAEWLPEGHLAWFVVDTVAVLDLGGFYARYRADGRGGAAYDPAMMVALLVYAYCVGDRSSRVIERRLVEDVAYRVVAGNARIDHATIARFRAENEEPLAGLFTQVLALCAAAGMVRVGLVAVDGTKLAADAAGTRNMTDERLERAIRAEVARILGEAAALDQAEDERFEEAQGDELPAELAQRSTRLARLREAKARLAAAQAERDAQADAKAARAEADRLAGRKRRGRAPKLDPQQKPLLINVTDLDSKAMKTAHGFLQGYNAQAVATTAQVIIAAELTNRAVDVNELAPTLAAAEANLAAAGVSEPIGTLVADAGYYSTANATLDTATDVLIATSKFRKLPTTAPQPAPAGRLGADIDAENAERAATLDALLTRVERGELTLTAAAAQAGISRTHASGQRARWRVQGIAALVRKRAPDGQHRETKVTHERAVHLQMQARLATEEGRALYRKRSPTIEPIFGQIKHARAITRFQRRGLAACDAEWKLIAATHNLLKLRRHNLAPTL